VAARDAKINVFVYACRPVPLTYGDSEALPKVEDENWETSLPIMPFTKYVTTIC